MMKVKLVFEDWHDSSGQSVYNTEKGIELSAGDFHFEATIEVEDPEWLRAQARLQLDKGFTPVFYVVKKTT